jgi:SPP1 family predicted phage head-tail adaptor
MIGAKRNTTSRLRHRLSLQQEVSTPDGAGGYTRNWQEVAQLWAEIAPLSSNIRGGEMLMAGQIQSRITHKVTLRYREGITAGMRLVFDAKVFNIRYVDDINKGNGIIEMLVEEGGAA